MAVAMLAWYVLSSRVCLSVGVSVIFMYSVKTSKLSIMQTMPHDSPETLIF